MNLIYRILNYIYIRSISMNRVAKKLGVNFGKNCKFSRSIDFGSEPFMIFIGDDFYCSENVRFITHDGSVNVIRKKYKEYDNMDLFGLIEVGNNVFAGYGVVILPGSKIKNNVIIGAGSIVKGELKENSVYAGVPAKFICTLEDYVKRNSINFLHTKKMNQVEKKTYLEKWVKDKMDID